MNKQYNGRKYFRADFYLYGFKKKGWKTAQYLRVILFTTLNVNQTFQNMLNYLIIYKTVRVYLPLLRLVIFEMKSTLLDSLPGILINTLYVYATSNVVRMINL